MASSTKMDANQLARLLGAWATGSGPLYRQLADGIVSLIDVGALRHQTVLPPERALATALSVSRSTVVAAYGELKEQGQLTRRQGSGTQVVASHVPGPEHGELRSAPMFDPGTETRALLQAVPPPLIDVAAELRQLGSTERLLGLDDVEPEGMWPLRAAIADRYTAIGLPTGPEQVLVTSGTQQACTLLLAELCQPGDVVLCEDYTWPGLTDTAERLGARCHGIPGDEGGLDVSHLRSAIERLRPTAIVVNPHHQNPTGTRMLPHRRRELAKIAADYGVMVIEDRVFADLAFDGVVPVPLAAHRPDAPIAVADSLSKTVWSGYRLGWIRASTDLIGRLRYGKALDDLGTSVPSQLLALQVFPRLDALIEARREQLAAAAESMHGLLGQLLPDWSLSDPLGGASLWVELPVPAVRAFVRHAARCGVLLIGDDAFAVREPADRHLRLPFTADEAEWTMALERLALAWRSFDPSRFERTRHRTALV